MNTKIDIIEYIDNKVDKFSNKVDQRFDKMEKKLDVLVEFRSKTLGIIVGITSAFTLLINLVVIMFKK